MGNLRRLPGEQAAALVQAVLGSLRNQDATRALACSHGSAVWRVVMFMFLKTPI